MVVILRRLMKQLLLDIVTPPAPSFDNMVAGENIAAIQAARSLVPGQTMYVWGQDGCGRSHLLQAFCAQNDGRYLNARHDSAQLHALVEDFPQELGPRSIAVDDIHLASDETLGLVFRLYNLWRERGSSANGFALMVSGNRPPLQMQCREDLRSRLGWGPVFRLMPLSDEQKMAALIRFAQQQSIPLGTDVIKWMLTHGSRDIRVLFDWITALDHYALTTHRTISLPLLKTMLADRNGQESS